MSVGSEIVKDLLAKYPDAPTKQLSRMAYTENPLVFTKEDTVRSMVRYYRGAIGNKHRQSATAPRDPAVADAWRINPFGLPASDNDDWKPIPFPVTKGWGALLYDVHSPYHDIGAMTLCLKHCKDRGEPDFMAFMGDAMDFYQVSKYEKDPRKRSLEKELDAFNLMLDAFQREFPKAQLILKLGNHDDRLRRYVINKAPELTWLVDKMLEKHLKLVERGVIVVPQDVPMYAGKLNIIHGHEMPGASGGVNPARGAYLKAVECVILGHYHRTAMHAETSFSRRLDTAWSVGCLGNLSPEYARINKWNHGFAIMEVDGNNFKIENKRISVPHQDVW